MAPKSKGAADRHLPDPLGARASEVLGQAAVALEIGHAHSGARGALAAHLGEQVHLGPAHVQGGDHVQDAQGLGHGALQRDRVGMASAWA
jgi:hypothetical protein